MQSLKKIVALLIAVSMLVSACAITVFAADSEGWSWVEQGDANSDKSIQWEYDPDTKNLTFTYLFTKSKEIRDYKCPSNTDGPEPDWRYDEAVTLTVKKNITKIGMGTFMNSTALTTVTLYPDDLVTIADYAFYNTPKLKTINFYGTAKDWEKISIGKNNGVLNYSIADMAENGITFNDKCALSGGHTFPDVWTPATSGTCSVKGTESRACTVCGYVETRETDYDPTSHDFDLSAWAKDETGHWHGCKNCTEKTDFSTHDYGEWQEITPATPEKAGLKQRVCTTCEYVDSAEIPYTVTKGDVNGDKKIDADDAELLAKYITGLVDSTSLNLEVADMNDDKLYDINDCVLIVLSVKK